MAVPTGENDFVAVPTRPVETGEATEPAEFVALVTMMTSAAQEAVEHLTVRAVDTLRAGLKTLDQHYASGVETTTLSPKIRVRLQFAHELTRSFLHGLTFEQAAHRTSPELVAYSWQRVEEQIWSPAAEAEERQPVSPALPQRAKCAVEVAWYGASRQATYTGRNGGALVELAETGDGRVPGVESVVTVSFPDTEIAVIARVARVDGSRLDICRIH